MSTKKREITAISRRWREKERKIEEINIDQFIFKTNNFSMDAGKMLFSDNQGIWNINVLILPKLLVRCR